jgi:acid phosphatase
MPGNCRQSQYPADAATYTMIVNPWTYFPASRARCRTGDVSMAAFHRAAVTNSLPTVGFLVPNLCHDAHNCSLASADGFLSRTLPGVLASRDFTSGRLVVVVTGDEDNRSAGNTVLTSVLAARLHGRVVTAHLTHYSLTRYIAQTLGVPPLRHGRSAPDMRATFGL